MTSPNRMPLHSIKCPTDLWEAAQEAARQRGDDSLSEVIRRHLTSYVKTTPATVQRRQSKTK